MLSSEARCMVVALVANKDAWRDNEGYISIKRIHRCVDKYYNISWGDLRAYVRCNSNKFVYDRKKDRVKLIKPVKYRSTPPETLYLGIRYCKLQGILANGIENMTGMLMSNNYELAKKGFRPSSVVVLKVMSGDLCREGCKIREVRPDYWYSFDPIPAKYIKLVC